MDALPLGSVDQINRVVETLLKVNEKKKKNNLTSALEPEHINLQFGLKKIPNVKNKIIKIPIPHNLIQSTTDICLFVKDLDKSNRDYDPTVRHYKELLESKGIDRQVDIIPLKSLKLEYQPFEAKKNLSNMYDIYLADDRVVGKLPALLGKNFLSRKKFPVQLKLSSKDLKKQFNKVLSMTQCVLSGRGSSCQVHVAHTTMTPTQISDNVEAAINKLSVSIPGGATNIKNLHLKTVDSPALPLYASFDSGDTIVLPKRKFQSQEMEAEEITTVEDALVKITRRGRIQVIPEKREEEKSDECQAKQIEDSSPVKNPEAKKKTVQKGKKSQVVVKKSRKRSLTSAPPKKKKKL